ncbi:Putative tetratricopeptide-like helical domain superfamily [Septoria linicola]|uniref:Tetratricopeptide-like helical domain superfamily n=1 Tax=Septoria linicola TaxID=215465 RepID=A0A9Q9EJ90_9PEZI|nr:putative tetratricopeptide-like helical domain superfamily [Septoria linicola]USW51108.1 Putative tetratricopeptide-like helical domain superfamily [Septoria linicola]
MGSLVKKVPNSEKGQRYLGLLDTALCNGSWSEVPELARKVEKHAPERKCLTLAARSEAQAASASHRPTSASSAAANSIHSLGEAVPRLLEAISTADTSQPDDAYIARTCLAQIHWIQEAPLEALQVLASSSRSTAAPAEKGGPATLGWLEVCEVKAAYITASCLESSGSQSDARETYQAATSRTPGYRTPELRRWTERLLGRACMYTVKKLPSPSVRDLSETYYAFKAWGDFWQRAPSASVAKTASSRLDVPRRQVWKAYYDLLSTVLQHDLLYSPYPGPGADAFIFSNTVLPYEQRTAAKQRQRAEMQRVETVYESLLLEETKFPKASQLNNEVEEWTAQVIENWRRFTGSEWTNSDLGDGGRNTVSRATLDILYRAATKTFHSTAILRQLFTVHAALGEFDLAMHAFDSYVEIIDKAKARAEKTGKHETGSDDDDTSMLTAADAVRLLCRYGDRDQAEKAGDIVNIITKWLAQQRPRTAEAPQIKGDSEGYINPASQPSNASLRPTTLAAAYRAIGISKAHWAHLTFESADRAPLLGEALDNLQRAHRLEPSNVDNAHALALVLAQTRDVSGAIGVIRGALNGSVMLNGDADLQQNHERERHLLSLWHLLALCLSAQDKYDTAAQICEAAYKQFGNSSVLFGQRITSLDPEKAVAITTTAGAVDSMEGFEKESILQIRISQISLLELMEGPEAAVDLTDSLLGLYSRLFGNPEHVTIAVSRPPQTAATTTPSRFGGTLRSITGSIRPRSARSRRSSTADRSTIRQRSVTSADGTVDLRPATNGQSTGAPIAITVTNEDGSPADKKHHSHHLHLPFHKHHNNDTSARTSATSFVNANENTQPSEGVETPVKASQTSAASPEQPLREVAHNAPHDTFPQPAGHDDQPPVQDVRLPAPHPASASSIPETHLLPVYERRHKVGVLIKTWLFVSGLYLRADSYDDAQNAVEHATKLVESLENEFASSEDGVNAQRLFEKGWGGSKSIDELWADVWSTKAHLAIVRQRPYEAIAAFEQALSYYPDHSAGIIGLSDILLDIYEQKLPAEEPLPTTRPLPSASGSLINEAKPSLTRPNTASSTEPSRRPSLVSDRRPQHVGPRKKDPTPAELNRIAARDRAYMLLSNLTKLGTGWDDSEAWSTLARAHELSREIGKAKQALWWVVELEDSRPVRGWREVSPGGYTL